MLGFAETAPWQWAGFIFCLLIFIGIDMGAFSRRPRLVTYREALLWSLVWFSLAMLFAGLMVFLRGSAAATEFVTGYLIELSLSLDNILIIAIIFTTFRVPEEFQRRVLVLGIIGALVMRGVMIGAGAVLVQRFAWVLYVFGVFLVFAGVRMLLVRHEAVNPERFLVTRVFRRLFPVSPNFDGQKLVTRSNGLRLLTPLALVLVIVETSDLLFAVDSVPAVFSVTRSAFVVFTSNMFAILGLRSMYFLLSGAIGRFRYLKTGLSLVLVFVGIKMLLDPHDRTPQWFQVEIPTTVSLLVVLVVLTTAMVLSMAVSRRDDRAKS
jgi:tellurite resistance protein TerC